MPRGRAAPASRSAAAAAPRARPAASSSPPPQRSYASSSPAPATPQRHAPPPMHSAPAPPPAMASGGGGGGLFSGIMGSVVTGAAMGTGSAVASRAIDGMMGPREVVHRHEQPEAAAPVPAAPMAAYPQQGDGPCGNQVKAFAECMSKNGDMAACQYYFDAMQQCKMYA